MQQKKLLFYVHDGSGLGHLRRLSRIAAYLQGEFVCLIVTGQRDALWVIDNKCEFIHLPNWDSLSKSRSKVRDKPIWQKLKKETAIKFKSNLFISIIKEFEPDAIFVDYLPFGKYNELKLALSEAKAKKYLIHRGIIDPSDNFLFSGKTTKSYTQIYDRIIVTADAKIADVSEIYRKDKNAFSKISYVGYVTPSELDKHVVRLERGIKNKKWVVCSAGGGGKAEFFFEQCVELAKKFPSIEFDIIT